MPLPVLAPLGWLPGYQPAVLAYNPYIPPEPVQMSMGTVGFNLLGSSASCTYTPLENNTKCRSDCVVKRLWPFSDNRTIGVRDGPCPSGR